MNNDRGQVDVKTESDRSFSGGSNSSSDSSSGSSEAEDDSVEAVRIMGVTLELPQVICEDYAAFKEIFSMKTWESLDDKHKEDLKQLLPKFEENQEEETEKTIKMLFNYEPFHFSSPLDDFFKDLKQGNYRPDIAKMRKFLKKARAKQEKHKIKSYYAKLLPEVLICRERLLTAAKYAPPGPIPRIPCLPLKPSSKNKLKPVYLRAKQRYFEELAAIQSEVGGAESDDDNYPEGPPEPAHKKRKQMGANGDSNISGTLGMSDQHPTSMQCLKNVLAAHRARRQYRENHPELNTTGITLEDIKQRVALVNGTKKIMFGGQKLGTPVPKLKRGPKRDSKQRVGGKEIKQAPDDSDIVENKPLLPNIKIKCEQDGSDSGCSSFLDPMASPRQSKRSVDSIEIKQEIVDNKYPNVNNSCYDPTLEIKEEPPDTHSGGGSRTPAVQPIPIKLEDLDGIDMMALPIEIADDGDAIRESEDSQIEVDESLTETTHANFLSLVRALFPARDAHRASKRQLHARCAAVIRSPIAPLNTWYNLSDDWCADLDSALDFLAGERGSHPDDFVPYLQYMPETQIYQWIGAGRDCDAILGRLCERWLRATSPQMPSKDTPPPKYPTSWTVRPPTSADIYEFRSQERRRFTTAAKPFTYIQHGYRAVVGPCARSWGSCGGAGAALLTAERPRHASFASLVRDALARLPNGEGTRHDVLTLLKMSQYIAQCSDQALLNAVTTVLERFSTAKRDPVVKYDQRTAIWTYLHRNKTEEDWANKTPSGRNRGGKAAALPSPPEASPPPLAPATPPVKVAPPLSQDLIHSPPHAMDLDVSTVEEVVEASDSDVDVDDSNIPGTAPQLPAAQLLIQATQTKQPSPPKPKKPTIQKRSYTPKQNAQVKQTKAALMTQSVKQANLLAQSVKTILNPSKTVPAVKSTKQTVLIPNLPQTKTMPVKQVAPKGKTTKIQIKPPAPSPKQPPQSPKPQSQSANPPSQSPKPSSQSPKPLPQSPKPQAQSPKPLSQSLKPATESPKPTPQPPMQPPMQPPQSPKDLPQSPQHTNQIKASVQSPMQPPASPKPNVIKAPTPSPKSTPSIVKTVISPVLPLPMLAQTSLSKSLPSVVATSTAHKSPLLKQRPLLNRSDPNLVAVTKVSPSVISQLPTTLTTVIQPVTSASTIQTHTPNKVATQGTRSLLIRPPALQSSVSAATPPRRGVLRVLTPATAPAGKSLISPQALLQDSPAPKKRATVSNSMSSPQMPQLQSLSSGTSVVNSAPVAVTSAAPTRTVQLAGGRTVQLAATQTVHLPAGQAVQLSSGHTLQLSSLQLPTQSVRLPSGQTVQLATAQTMQALKASTTKTTLRPQSAPKTIQSIQVPVSTVQLAGQTVQIGGQTVQLAGQSVQLTGHTVKLPSGQSVQVASQNVLSSNVQLPSGQTVQLPSGQTVQLPSGQTVQLPSGQTVQLATGNVQTVQISGSNVQLQTSGQNVQLPQTVQLGGGQNVQTVQIGGQTVQLASGQSVQIPSGQTIQLPSGQTVQLSSGQTLQLASGQTVQLANQVPKSAVQTVRSQPQVEKTAAQPIVAKLLTNAQGQMVSIEGLGGARTLVSGVKTRPNVRVLSPRLARPLLLTSAKPLHNIILQQSDGTVRVPASVGASTSQTVVISNIASPTVSTPTTSTPVLKLQQVNPIHQVKLAQGIKLQPTCSPGAATSSGVRSVLMDGQQLKLVGGRHVLARILRPAHPPNQ